MHDLFRHSQPGTTESVVAFGDPNGWRYEAPSLACAGLGVMAALAAGSGDHVELGALAGIAFAAAAVLMEKRDRQARKRCEKDHAAYQASQQTQYLVPSDFAFGHAVQATGAVDVGLRNEGVVDPLAHAEQPKTDAQHQQVTVLGGRPHAHDGDGHDAPALVPLLDVEVAHGDASQLTDCGGSHDLSIPPFAPASLGAETRGPAPARPAGPRTPEAAR